MTAPTLLSPDEIAAGVLRLAELADDPDLKPGMPAILSALTGHPDPMPLFNVVVEAVDERDRYLADPPGYANAHGWPRRWEALDGIEQRLCTQVDETVRALIGGAR